MKFQSLQKHRYVDSACVGIFAEGPAIDGNRPPSVSYLEDREIRCRTTIILPPSALRPMETIDDATLFELLKCPVEWYSICPENELCYWLNYAWYWTVRRHQVDFEGSVFSSTDWTPGAWELASLDSLERKSLKTNIDIWRESARASYVRSFRGLRDLRVATPGNYPKHYCPKASTDEDVATLSRRRGEGVLYPRLTPERQKDDVWSALLELWATYGEPSCDINELRGPNVISAFESLFVRNNLTIAREFCEPIGCCRGAPSNYGLLKYDFSAALVHIHPVSPQEADRLPFKVTGWLFH